MYIWTNIINKILHVKSYNFIQLIIKQINFYKEILRITS